MPQCFSARSHRKPSSMSVSATSSGTGGPSASISVRLRISVCDIRSPLDSLDMLMTLPRLVARKFAHLMTSLVGIVDTASSLIQVGKPSQSHGRIRLNMPRALVVFDCFIVTSGAFKHRGSVQAGGQFATSTRKCLVSIVVLTRSRLSQSEIVQYSLVAGGHL